MTNVVKFPRQEGSKPQQIRAVEDVAGPASENTVRKWSDGPFAAAWPFVTSFLVLATLTYIMATWKPKVS